MKLQKPVETAALKTRLDYVDVAKDMMIHELKNAASILKEEQL